jgi:hypothetical protein
MKFGRTGKMVGLHGSRGWAAIHFGPISLNMAVARLTGGTAGIEKENSFPATPTPEGEAATGGQWDAAVQSLQKEINLNEHRVVTAVGCEDAVCFTLSLPTTDAGELKQMLDLQIDNLTPLPIEEVVYSFESLEKTADATRVLVAVAPKASVNEKVAVLEKAGLPPELVTIETLAVFRALLRQGQLPADENLNTMVHISPIAANIILYSRSLPLAVRSLSFETGGIGSPEAQAILGEELRRTLLAVEMERPELAAGKLTLLSQDPAQQGELESLAARWGGEVQCLLNGAGPSLPAAIGLETVTGKAAGINLLPDEWRQRRQTAHFRRLLIRCGIVLGVIYVLVLVGFLTFMWMQRSQLRMIDRQIAKARPRYEEARQTHAGLIAMQKQLDAQYSALEVLREVTTLMPDNLKCSSFAFKKDQTVTLKGQAQSAAMYNDFVSRLEKCVLFSKVAPGQSRIEPGTGLTRFEVVCTLKSAATTPTGAGPWR